MKRAECDQCKSLVDAADMIYGTPPKGWLQITKQGEYPGKDFCSIACALDWLADQVKPNETPEIPEIPDVDLNDQRDSML